MNKVTLALSMLFLISSSQAGEYHTSCFWYCKRCGLSVGHGSSIDEIIENRVPAKPGAINCRDASGSTSCVWVLNKTSVYVLSDDIEEHRIKKSQRAVTDEFRRTNKKSAYQIIQETRGREYVEPQLTITNEATEKVKNFNTDLVAPAAPFEVLKK